MSHSHLTSPILHNSNNVDVVILVRILINSYDVSLDVGEEDDYAGVDVVLHLNFLPSSEGLPGVLGNKGTKGKYRREQGNMTPVLGNKGT